MDFKFIPLATLLSALIALALFAPARHTGPATGTPAAEASTVPTASDTLDLTDQRLRTIESRPPIKAAAVVTWKGGPDHRWSDPDNWEGGRVPGRSDVARFAARSSSAVMDAASPGAVASLVLEPDYRGTLTLERDLTVSNYLVLGGGTINQRNYRLSVSHYRQTGGMFRGGDASLLVQYEATISGGTQLTSKLMTAQSLTIESPAVVTLATGSKLNLTGDGEPLSGNGLLDVTTHGPNSLEYTGRATADVTAAGPVRGALGTSGPAQSQMPSMLRGLIPLEPSHALGALGPAKTQMPSLLRGLAPPEPSHELLGSFSRSAALTLTRKEDPMAATIDTVNGFAYFGTYTSYGNPTNPGVIVKVRLSDFTRVGALVLNAGENDFRCATIDTASGFAYFGGLSGYIVKVRLSDFSRVGSFGVGGPLAAAVIDTANGFAYFGAYTSPAAVIKVRLSDFTPVDVLVFNSGEEGILSAVIDSGNGFAYFGTGNINEPASVVKVRLSDFTRVGGVVLNFGETQLTCAVIDTANGFAYFGVFNTLYSIVKIRLDDLTRVGAISPNDGQLDFIRSAVIDTTSGFAYFGDNWNRVMKIRLSDFTPVAVLTLDLTSTSSLFCAVIDTENGFAYFGVRARHGVAKVRLSDFTYVGVTAFSNGENSLDAAVIDTANGFAYFGTNTSPGTIVKVRLSDFTRVGLLTLNSEEFNSEYSISCGVIDTSNGFAYFGMDSQPGKIVKVRLSDFTRVGGLTFNEGEIGIFSAVIDPANGFAYFGALTHPKGRVIKVRLSDLTRVGGLTLNDDERPRSMVIDAINGYAYFGTYTGIVGKVRLSDLTRIDAFPLAQDQLLSAVADPAAGFAYFGSYGGRVYRLRLPDFTGAGSLNLSSESNLQSATIDPDNGHAYFGSFTSPGRVAKVRLSSFTRVAGLTLNPGEDYLSSAVIDPVNSFAYFGTLTQPGIVVRIQLGDATPTPTPTASPTSTPTVTPTATPTPTPAGFEGDVAPRPDGDGSVLSTDVTQIRRFVTGLDIPNPATNEAQRADSAPRTSSGDGIIDSGDVVQTRRYVTGLDPLTAAGGPTGPTVIPAKVLQFLGNAYAYFFGHQITIGRAESIDGLTVSIPVEMNINDNEAAVSFTLEYDAERFANPSVELGDAVSDDAVLTVNTNEKGRIVVLVDSGTAWAHAKGAKNVVVVTFDVADDGRGEKVMSFEGSISGVSISDVNGNPLAMW